MNVSVAMTSYNGEKYIYDQILSIVNQLGADDELIVSDDGSTDQTIQIVQHLSQRFPQIHLLEGPHKGVFRNFEYALMNCSNDIVFLSDQDDIWIEGKVKKIIDYFDKMPSTNVVMHRAYKMFENKKTDIVMVNYKKGFLQNLLKSSYWGCCMAIRREYIAQYLPYQVNGIAHDQLVGLLAEKDKCVHFDETPLIYHRFHYLNQTKRRKLCERLVFRISLFKDYLVCIFHRHKGTK